MRPATTTSTSSPPGISPQFCARNGTSSFGIGSVLETDTNRPSLVYEQVRENRKHNNFGLNVAAKKSFKKHLISGRREDVKVEDGEVDIEELHLLEVLGKGSFGTVVSALVKHEFLGAAHYRGSSAFAIKCIRESSSGSESTSSGSSFIDGSREAQVGVMISGHPNIVRVIGVTHAVGHTIIAMEHLQGPCLADLLRGQGRLAKWKQWPFVNALGAQWPTCTAVVWHTWISSRTTSFFRARWKRAEICEARAWWNLVYR